MNNSESAHVRPASSADLDALIELLRLLFGIEQDFTFNELRQRQGLQLMLANDLGIVLVAEKNGRVIGMSTGQLVISTAEGGSAVLVEDVVVLHNYQGQGVGKLLMHSIIQWAEENNGSRLQLLADKNNQSAIAFYKSLGWDITDLICLRNKKKTENEL